MPKSFKQFSDSLFPADVAYKGYLIKTNSINMQRWIEKGGVTVYRCPPNYSIPACKEVIDQLVDE